jgi:hypothetical protein
MTQLLKSRQKPVQIPQEPGKRTAARWPFPGAVEIWVPNADGTERHVLGACQNLTEAGVGVRCDQPIEVGLTMPIAIHQPEASFHGKGTVRHCTMRGKACLVGFEFIFGGD